MYSVLFAIIILSCSALTTASDDILLQLNDEINNFEAFGNKLATNNILTVTADNNNNYFEINFSPYNQWIYGLPCQFLYYNTTSDFIYNVAIGKKQNQTQQYFVFGGFNTMNDATFIGILNYTNITASMFLELNLYKYFCTEFQYKIHFFPELDFTGNYIVGIDPFGQYAFGFRRDIIIIYNILHDSVKTQTWSNNFIPFAVDFHLNFGVITGYIDTTGNSSYQPCVRLFTYNSSGIFILDQWCYSPSSDSWEASITYYCVDFYVDGACQQSISINDDGQILFGMPLASTVILLYVDPLYLQQGLLHVKSESKGQKNVGYGKSVAWLNNNYSAILYNIYTSSYQWVSSQIYLYNNFQISTTNPISILPNYQQPLISNMDPSLIFITYNQFGLVIIDIKGMSSIIFYTQPGFYSQFYALNQDAVPRNCSFGMYKNMSGIHSCDLCLSGTKASGYDRTNCVECQSPINCPTLGSITEIDYTQYSKLTQVQAYPRSPESTIFDDILFGNIFRIGSSYHCIVISPLFWSLMFIILAIIILILMTFSKYYTKQPHILKTRLYLENFFKYIDLVTEGKVVPIGGLITCALLIILCYSYYFTGEYVDTYPIERAKPSTYACSLSLSNSKFSSNLQSLGIPLIEEEQHLFDLLTEQKFQLNLDLINTLFICDDIKIAQIKGNNQILLPIASCVYKKGIISLSVLLPSQRMTLQLILDGSYTIGGLRIGLQSDEIVSDDELYKVLYLKFYELFVQQDHILSQAINIELQLTKIMNETEPLYDHYKTEFSGLWLPTFIFDTDQMYLTQNDYINLKSLSTIIQIILTETTYYIKNEQKPIVKRGEAIFKNLLITIVCLEIFGLLCLIFKLILIPLSNIISGDKTTSKTEKHKIKQMRLSDKNSELSTITMDRF